MPIICENNTIVGHLKEYLLAIIPHVHTVLNIIMIDPVFWSTFPVSTVKVRSVLNSCFLRVSPHIPVSKLKNLKKMTDSCGRIERTQGEDSGMLVMLLLIGSLVLN